MISHYKITRKLGFGGMGEVFLAEDARLDRQVALKFIPDTVVNHEKHRYRFITEAKAASAINHPNVCIIYEVGEANDGTPFIAMEYIQGKTLSQMEECSIKKVIDIGIQIADALDAAFSKGIVHRDIKPSNICLNERGQVKVLDFGLAKRLEEEVQSCNATTQFQTQEGAVLGTPNFMSPEQAMGKDVDHRTDIFSFGVVLYQLATGQLPFLGSSIAETTSKILHTQPTPILRLNNDVPLEMERIILKCLNKEPENRYQSANDLLVDLRNLYSKFDGSSALQPTSSLDEFLTLLYLDVANVDALKTAIGTEEAAKQIIGRIHELDGGEMVFAPDSKTLATASRDGTVTLWNIVTGQRTLTFHHQGPATGVSFSNDGNIMATSGADGTVNLWSAPLLKEIE